MMPYFCRFHPGQVEVAPALLMLAREGGEGTVVQHGGAISVCFNAVRMSAPSLTHSASRSK